MHNSVHIVIYKINNFAADSTAARLIRSNCFQEMSPLKSDHMSIWFKLPIRPIKNIIYALVCNNSHGTVNIIKIESELAYIGIHFKILLQTFKTLEASDETLVKNIERTTLIRGSSRKASGVVVKKANIEAILPKNPRFCVLYEISQVLNGYSSNDHHSSTKVTTVRMHTSNNL